MEKIYCVKEGFYKTTDRVLNNDILDRSEGENLEVFYYSLILYEFLMKKDPVHILNLSTVTNFSKGYRPPLDDSIPICYKKLINECWKDIGTKDKNRKIRRQRFISILDKLKKPEFILDDVDKDAYFQ